MSVSVEWVLFDADGVLQSLADGWLDDLTALGGEDFVIALFGAEHRSMAGAEDFREVAHEVLTEFGLSADVDAVAEVANRIVVDDGMLAEVARLRAAGVRCGLATNQQNVRGAYMAANLGYTETFDATFYSYELGAAKPSTDYFRTILGRIAAPADRVLFLDDKQANVDGARAVGMLAELFPQHGGVAALRPILDRYDLGTQKAPRVPDRAC